MLVIILQKPTSEFIGLRDIMEAILLLPGPVASPKAVKSTRRYFRHHLKTDDFITAAEELEKADFGRLVVVPMRTQGGRNVKIFLKKPPVEVEHVFGANPDLCTFQDYCMHYAKGSPKSISFLLRAKLVAMKLVTQDHFM